MFGVLPFVEYPELSATATLFNTHTVTDTRLQLQDHHHPIAIMTDLEDIATEDLAIAESSVAISSQSPHHGNDDVDDDGDDDNDDGDGDDDDDDKRGSPFRPSNRAPRSGSQREELVWTKILSIFLDLIF